MPIQHPHALIPHRFLLLCAVLWLLILPACAPVAGTPASLATLNILIAADGKQQALEVPSGATVQAALEKAGIKLNPLDRTDPPGFTVLKQPVPVRVIRVKEEFKVKENVIPFQRQTVRNESLPQGQTLLIQAGINGLQQVTYRLVLEDGMEVSNSVFKTSMLTEARPEIIMVGVQTPFTAADLPGRLAYLTAGNAWLMEKTTGNRKPLVTTGDLDGRVFALSADGAWLLYTRKSADKDTINTLWMVRTTAEKPVPVDLRVKNIVNYAGWAPGTALAITYSTVETRAAPPGWQANNDLQYLQVNANGVVVKKKEMIKTNSGGIYGWWGASFSWSPDGKNLAYARPDGVGLVDQGKGEMHPLLDILPLQTRSDWAWVPGLDWSPDSSILYTVNHAIQAGMNTPEESPLFDVTALLSAGGPVMALAQQAGMFAYPSVSPLLADDTYMLAYLQAIFPEQSETSNYRLVLADRDGSNRQAVFPAEDLPGMAPQQVSWSPAGFGEQKQSWIGLVYQGNLWFLDPWTKQSQQVTGDGSISRVDWK